MVDVGTLSDDDLEALRVSVESEAKRRIVKQRAAVRKQIAELAEKHAIDLTTIAPRSTRKGDAAPAEPRYRDPANEFNTWAGKGRKPKWLIDRIAAGDQLEDLEIKT